MDLTQYYQKYANQSDVEIENKVNEKRLELTTIFHEVELKTNDDIVPVAVLGCGDKRFVKYHKQLFEDILKRPVKLTTFDITIDHLEGEENIVQHDCTLPLPNGPYDITFAHVLLKFIETDKQWNVIRNSYDVLKPGGIAIHILDEEDYETKEQLLSNGQFSVPLERWKEQLAEFNIKYKEISIKYGLALVILK